MAARKAKLKLDSAGLNKAMAKTVAPMLEEAAKEVTAGISGYSTGVQSGLDRNGRPVAYAAITEPHGMAIQAKHGTLTRAAAEQGLDIHRYPIEGA